MHFGQQNLEELFGNEYQLLSIIDDGTVQGSSKYDNKVQAKDLA